MVLNLYHIESLNSGYDIVLEFVFGVVTFLLAMYAMKMFEISRQKSAQYFGRGFFFISASYLIQSLFNFLILSQLNVHIIRVAKIKSIPELNNLGLYAHIIFMIIGLATLAYMSFKTEKTRILWLLIILSVLTVVLSRNQLFIFFLLSSLYLIFISYHFLENYLARKSTKTLMIALAFLFLLFGRLHFIFSANHVLFYPLGHFLELAAYLLIIANFYYVKKDEQKARSPRNHS